MIKNGIKKIVLLIEFIFFLLWIICWFIGLHLYAINKPKIAAGSVMIGCVFYFIYVICDKVAACLERDREHLDAIINNEGENTYESR